METHNDNPVKLSKSTDRHKLPHKMVSFIIYNFSGHPGDLFQLIPHRYLASFLGRLNGEFSGSTELWDRGNLNVAQFLSLKGTLQKVLAYLGGRLFASLKAGRPVTKKLIIPFQIMNLIAQWFLKKQSSVIISRDVKAIIQKNIKIVFLNFFQGPGLESSLQLARLLKRKAPHIRIIGIGHRIAWLREYSVYLSPHIDAYVMGTHSVDAMVQIVRGGIYRDIPNLIYKGADGKPVYTGLVQDCAENKSSFPEYHDHVYKGIHAKLQVYELSLSNEACPYKCHFCVRPVNYGTHWVRRSVNNVVDEIEHLVRAYNACLFRISDSTPPIGMLTELAREIIKRGLHKKIAFTGFSRCSERIQENFELIKSAGCKALFVGVESGSQRILTEILGKKTTVKGIEHTVRVIHNAGIGVVVSLIAPAPRETRQTLEETFQLLKRLKPCITSVLMQPAGVYPNTEWWSNPEKYGIALSDDYITKVASYPIEPLKPLRFWPSFPFSYEVFGKPAAQVKFQDIVKIFTEFESRVRKELNLPNIQDYTYLVALHSGQDPAQFSLDTLENMVTRSIKKLAEMVTTGNSTSLANYSD